MSVTWNGCQSYWFRISNGVRQGGKLSPFLFNIYINDLIRTVSSAKVGCHVGSLLYNILAYADDIVLLSPTCSGMRHLISICEAEAVKIDVEFNPDKSKCMLFKSLDKRFRLNDGISPSITLSGNKLEFVTHFQYLGHIITEDLSETLDIDRVRRSLCKQGNMIISRFPKASGLVRLTLFRSFCLNLFGAELWSPRNESKFKAIKVIYHDIVKRLVGVQRQMNNHLVCHDFQLLTFDKLIASRKINFFNSIVCANNYLLFNLCNQVFCSDLFNDITYLLHKYEIGNLDFKSCSKQDIKHVFTCMITRVALRQRELILDEPL